MNSVISRVMSISRVLLLLAFSMVTGIEAGKNKCPFIVNPKAGTVCPGGSITFDALEGNSGKKIQLVAVSEPTNGGTVTINRKCNTFTYTAPEKAPVTCDDHFTYTLEDKCGERKTAPVTITITCCEELVVNDTFITVAPFGSITFSALEGNSGCNLALVRVGNPVNGGTATADQQTNMITYTTSNDPSKTSDMFTYTMAQTCPTIEKTATVHVTIAPCTVPFEVNPKSGLVCAGASLSFDATDGNSGCSPLELTDEFSDPQFGTVAKTGTSTFAYTANPGVPEGTIDTFTYSMTSQGETKSAQVQIRIINPPFEVNPLSSVVCAGSSRMFDALAANSGCGAVLVEVSDPAAGQGTVTCDCENNTFTYSAPSTLAEGTVITFTYTLELAGVQKSAPVTVTIINQPFVVNPITILVCPLQTAMFDIIPPNSGCDLTLVAVSQPQFGTARSLGNVVVYEAPGVVPEDGTDTFEYTASVPFAPPTVELSAEMRTARSLKRRAARALKKSATPQLAAENALALVDPTKTAPVRVTIVSGTPLIVNPFDGVIAPGQTIIFDPLLFCQTCDPALVSVSQPCPDSQGKSQGTVTPNFADITFAYAAPIDIPFNTVVTFEYTLRDGGQEQTACVTVRIVDNPLIVDPIAAELCPEGSVVFQPLATGSGGNRVLTQVFPLAPELGTITPNFTTNTITYRAPAGIAPGTIVTFRFEVALKDNLAISTIGTGTVTIKSVPFIVLPLTANVGTGGSHTFAPESLNKGCNIALLTVTQPCLDAQGNSQGTVTPHPDGTFTYNAPANLTSATVLFEYTMVDVYGATQSACVTVNVAPEPFAVPNLRGETCPDGSIVFYPLTVGSGVNRVLYSVTQPVGQDTSVTIRQADGTFTYRPPSGFLGDVQFTYTVFSTVGANTQSKTGNVTVSVVDIPFVTEPITETLCPGGSIIFDPLAIGTGCDRSMVGVTQPPAGLGTVTPYFYTTSQVSASTFMYRDTSPTGLAPGTKVPFTYTLQDASGALKTNTVTIEIIDCPSCNTATICDPFIVLYNQLILNQ